MAEAGGASVATWSDRLLDAVVVLLATWTVVYHLSLVLRLSTAWAVALEVVALAGYALLVHRRRAPSAGPRVTDTPTISHPGEPSTRGTTRWLAPITVAAACVAAAGLALSLAWILVWVPWLLAAASGALWAGRRLAHTPSRAPTSHRVEERWTAVGVLAWALGLGLYSMWTLRPNPDDLFYVNLSQWVADHGAFPLKDTLFSNLDYPMANWPPIASYDGLVGVVARIAGAHAATVEYVVVTPLATFLAVLALWRLLRAWRVHHPFWLLSTGLVFLLFDGTSSYASPGNLFLTRLWQGKIVLLCIIVPVLLVHGLRYVERPARGRLAPLVLGGIAAVGLTTTSMFLVPILAVAAMAPLAIRDRSRALLGFAALAFYPLGAGVVTLALGGRSADDFGARRLFRFDASWIGHQLLLTELIGFVVVLAMLLGALLVPHPQARLTTGILVLATGYVFIPGGMRASYDVLQLGPTLWRISWAASVAALVGVLAGYGGSRVTHRLLRSTRRPSWQRWDAPLACVVVMGLLVGFGAPIWSSDTATQIRSPLHWQRSYSSRHVATEILAATRPGDVVLAPDSLSITLAVTTTEVKTVAPRDYYMEYLQDEPSFHYPERLRLVRFVNHDPPRGTPGIAHDLDVVGVDVACTIRENHHRYDVIEAAGFRPLLTSTYYRCLIRS